MKLDLEAMQAAIVGGLPLRARWTTRGTPLVYDFSAARRGLRELPKGLVEGGDEEWSDLLIFGECDYADGGGACPWLGIRKTDGTVWGLDPERDAAMFLLNSSLERFIRTFALFNEYLGRAEDVPSDFGVRVREIDPQAYPLSDWRSLVDYLTDDEA